VFGAWCLVIVGVWSIDWKGGLLSSSAEKELFGLALYEDKTIENRWSRWPMIADAQPKA
jgi:hypothetical protein